MRSTIILIFCLSACAVPNQGDVEALCLSPLNDGWVPYEEFESSVEAEDIEFADFEGFPEDEVRWYKRGNGEVLACYQDDLTCSEVWWRFEKRDASWEYISPKAGEAVLCE